MQLTKELIESVDTLNMWGHIAGFPNQWDEAIKLTEDLKLTVNRERIDNICFAGMGGSAIGADILRAYSYHCCPHPVQVVRHYDIPGWVDERTLFIACSFSGNTEEALLALQQARKQQAQTVAVTSGGELLLQAARKEFDYMKIPGGMPARAALGYNFIALFRIFQYLGYLDEGDEALSETELFLSEQSELLSDIHGNEALSIAEDLNDTLPIIYSNAVAMQPVNLRWRGQLEENAKTLAYGNSLPEMTHNEIVGWERVIHLTGRLSVLILQDEQDHMRVQKRMSIIRDLIADQTATIHVLNTRGKSRLTRLFSLIQLADWTSYYLAVINRIDPTPTAKIDLLKSRLAEE